MSLLVVENLCITDMRTKTVLVNDVSFELSLGEVMGIIGESGSGKSLTCKTLLGLNPTYFCTQGSVRFEGEELVGMDEKRLRTIRGRKIAMVFQDAMNAFDPIARIGDQMVESLIERMRTQDAKVLALEWLAKMGLEVPERIWKAYAHELSGGMLQRVMIALCLAQETDIIIADELTSALDAIHQRQIIEFFASLKDEKRSLIVVSHDLAIVSYLADTVLVMKEGRRVEFNRAHELFTNPKHDYTRYLIQTRQMLSYRFSQCFA